MAGTSIICHGPMGRRRKIQCFDKTYCRSYLLLTKTGEPSQLDSEEEHQSDQQNSFFSPFQHEISLRYDAVAL